MSYADDIERVLPANHVHDLVGEAYKFFFESNRLIEEAEKNSRDTGRAAEERTRRIAEAHQQGWDKVARAINDGFREVAAAIRDSRR